MSITNKHDMTDMFEEILCKYYALVY